MVFLNGSQISGLAKLLMGIQVTCSLLYLQMQRDEPRDGGEANGVP